MADGIPVDREQFTALYQDTTNTKYDIAEALGLHPESVRNVALRLGLPLRPLMPHQGTDPERFTQLWNDGVPEEEIAAQLGIAVSSIRGIRHRLGLAIRPRKTLVHDPVLAEKVREKMAEGKSRAQIAEELGVKVDIVTRIRRRLGLPNFKATPPPPSEPRFDREMVRQMTEEERMTRRQIAEALGCSVRTVEKIRQELGISGPGAVPYSDETKAKAREMLEEGASYNEVSRTLGIPTRRLSGWFPGMGWTAKQAAEYRYLKRQMDELDGKIRTGLDWV